MPSFRIISILFTALIFTSPVFAANIDDQGAKALQNRFAQEIASKSNIKAMGHKVSLQGDVSVTSKSTYYEVIMPSVKLSDNSGNIINVGKIVMNMVPSNDNLDDYKTSMAVPSSMSYMGKTGVETARLTVESQRASGVWNMKMFGFRKLDSAYNDVKLTSVKTREQTIATNILTNYDLAKSGEGFSGPVNVVVNALNYVDANGAQSPIADQISIDTNIQSDKSAQIGYTQTSIAKIKGMSNAVNLIMKKMKDPNVTNKAQLQKAFGILTVLQMSGKTTDQADTKQYNLVTTPDGKTTLNGVDIAILFDALSVK